MTGIRVILIILLFSIGVVDAEASEIKLLCGSNVVDISEEGRWVRFNGTIFAGEESQINQRPILGFNSREISFAYNSDPSNTKSGDVVEVYILNRYSGELLVSGFKYSGGKIKDNPDEKYKCEKRGAALF